MASSPSPSVSATSESHLFAPVLFPYNNAEEERLMTAPSRFYPPALEALQRNPLQQQITPVSDQEEEEEKEEEEEEEEGEGEGYFDDEYWERNKDQTDTL